MKKFQAALRARTTTSQQRKACKKQIEADYLSLTHTEGVKAELESLKKTLGLCAFSAKEGTERKAFLSAVTPLGRINYADTFAANAKIRLQH